MERIPGQIAFYVTTLKEKKSIPASIYVTTDERGIGNNMELGRDIVVGCQLYLVTSLFFLPTSTIL